MIGYKNKNIISAKIKKNLWDVLDFLFLKIFVFRIRSDKLTKNILLLVSSTVL